MTKSSIVGWALSLAVILASPSAFSQGYPNKPIRFIVPITTGSVTDAILREASNELRTRLGQPIIIENRPGGSGVIGAQACAQAAPDGYTICALYTDITSFNPYLIPNLPYDPVKDFKPVTNLYTVIGGVFASKSLPVKSIAELKDLAQKRAATAPLSFATFGPGTVLDLFRLKTVEQWKAELLGPGYKGGADIINAIVKGEVDMSWIGVGNALQQIQEDKIRLLAVESAKRSRFFPDVQTFGETGVGLPIQAYWGLVVPAGTPDAIISRLNTEFVKVFSEPKLTELLERRFLQPMVGTPEAFAAFLKRDNEEAGKLVKAFPAPK